VHSPFSNRRTTASLLAVVLLGGCVSGGQPLNADVRALSPEEIRLQQVETKVAELSRRLDGMEASRNGTQVSDEVRSLRGQVEELRHDFEQAQQQNQAQQQSMGGAPAAAATPAAADAPASPGPAPTAAVTPPPPAAGGPAPQEEAVYKSSFAQLQGGHYDDAIRGFRGMLDDYPQGSFADNAWYWLGQTYTVKGDYASAAQSYQSLLQRFPNSTKVPDATLSLGMVDAKLNKREEAKAMFQKVVREYPNSRAASMASGQLSQLR
jgi:tol-pal system protein YbgF